MSVPTRRRRLRAGLVAAAVLPFAVSASAHATTPAPLDPIQNVADRAPQQRSLLVIPMNFASDPQEPRTRTFLQDEFFSTTAGKKSVANFYSQSSKGRLTLTGDVAPWTSIADKPLDSISCDYDQWVVDAAAKALTGSPAFDASNYDYVMVVPPTSLRSNGCPGENGVAFHGLPGGGYKYAVTWANAAPGEFLTGTTAHEFGHDLSLGHTLSLHCAGEYGVPVPVSDDCTEVDADIAATDVMGSSRDFRLLNAYNRLRLGFTPKSSLANVTANGTTYTLNRGDQALGTTNQVLRLRRTNATSSTTSNKAYYYLEYRAPSTPFDAFQAGHSATSGVTIHTGRDFDEKGSSDPLLVNPAPGFYAAGNAKRDVTPSGGGVTDVDAALLPGQNLYDPIENVTIRTVAVSATSAQVNIAAGPPTSEFTTGFGGGTLVLSSEVMQRDVVAVARVGSEIISSSPSSQMPAPSGCRQIDAMSFGCPVGSVRRINISTWDSNDVITVGPRVPANVKIIAGAGDDVVQSRGSAVRVEASSGADGADTIDLGSPGTYFQKTVSYTARTTPVDFETAADGALTVPAEGDRYVGLRTTTYDAPYGNGIEIYGGTANDTFRVGINRLLLDGRGGADRFELGEGDQTVIARGGGTDTVADCGAGSADHVLVDSADTTVSSCETVASSAQALITGGPEGRPALNAGNLEAYTFADPSGSTTTFQCATWQSGTALTWAPCTSPAVPTPVADGSYDFKVQALVGGVPTGSTVVRRFTYDATVPETTASASVAVVTASSSEALTNGGLQCSFASEDWVPCASPIDYSSKPEGFHTVRVRAVDAAGNIDATPAEVTVQVGSHYAEIELMPSAIDGTTVPLTNWMSPGQLDWIHWRSGTNASTFTRKSGGSGLQTWTPLGTGCTRVSTGVINTVTPTWEWTDAAGTAAGSSRNGAGTGVVGCGFELKVPLARVTERKLYVWIGVRGNGAAGKFNVSLRDGTTNTLWAFGRSDTQSRYRLFMVDLRSIATPDDELTLKWTLDTAPNSTAQVSLHAASLGP